MPNLETLNADTDEFKCLDCNEVFILDITTGHVCNEENTSPE